MITRFRLILVAGLAVIVLAAVAAACGDDDDNGGANGDVSAQLQSIQASLDELLVSSQRSGVLATMTTIRTEGLHELDQEVQQASAMQAGWDGSITRMAQAVGGTHWPDELSSDASDWHMKLTAASEALSSGDLAASKTAVAEAHAAWHNIEHGAYQYIAGEEVTGGNGHDAMDHDGDMDMENSDD